MKWPVHLAVPGILALGLTLLFAAGAGLVRADGTLTFGMVINPPSTAGFDIGFVKNDIAAYVLADSGNKAIDLFDAKGQTFTGFIGQGGFTGRPATCGILRGCNGPNGVLIDSNNHVWAGNGNSHVEEYVLAPSVGTSGRLADVDTGGKFRADEMAFDPRDGLILVANDDDGFLTFIDTASGSVARHFYYSDNTVGKPATVAGHATAGGGIEQPVYNPQQGFFYQAVPAGTSPGFIDVFNPRSPQIPWLRSIPVPGCDGGPTGLALDPATHEFLGACGNGAMLINANSGATTLIGSASTTGGADEVWFDPGSNNWYLGIGAAPGKLGVVGAEPGHAVQDGTGHGGSHSVAAYTSGPSSALVFQPAACSGCAAAGINVWKDAP